MTNHVNKGAQKSSVDQIEHDPNSAHEKALKWSAPINLTKKKRKRVNVLIYQKQTHSLRTVRLLFKHQIHT